MEEEQAIEEKQSRPRRSSRPSALKMYGITQLSEAFGIPLDSDSDSDQEFAPTNEGSSSISTSTDSDEESDSDDNITAATADHLSNSVADIDVGNLPDIEGATGEGTLEEPNVKSEKSIICCVCLESSKENDIVTCDLCGVTVHEGCYGVPEDNDSADDCKSEESSISTVPWFCDPCKAGVDNPVLAKHINRNNL